MLLMFACPSFVARMMMLPADELRQTLLAGEVLDHDALDELERSRLNVVDWFAHHSVANDLSMIALRRAQQPDTSKGVDYFARARAWQERGLASAPSNPYGWYRLAYFYFREDGASSRVARAWTQSLHAAPYEPRLALARLDLGTKIEGFLDDNAMRYLPSLMRTQANLSVDDLVRIALRGQFVARVEDALETDEDTLKEFRVAVSKQLRSSAALAARPALGNTKAK